MIREQILAHARVSDLSIRQLAELTGLERSNLTGVIQGRFPLGMKTAERLAHALKLKIVKAEGCTCDSHIPTV